MANNAATPAATLYAAAMQFPGALMELMDHPDWATITDPSNWLEDELRSILLASDLPDSFYQLDQLSPPGTRFWQPPGNLMTITGVFACLPPETIWRILHHLDFRSLTNFSRTCRYFRAVTKQFPTLKLLMRVVPKMRKLLIWTGLIYWHSLNDIMVELCHPRCRYCDANAMSLYLPTCERVCYNCQTSRKDLALVPIACCKYVLSLDDSSLRRLPILQIEKQTFNRITYPASEIIPEFITPVKCAAEEAVRYHGDLYQLLAVLGMTQGTVAGGIPYDEIFRLIHKEVVDDALDTSDLPQPGRPNGLPAESICTVASTAIPYLVPESEPTPTWGFCRGCSEVFRLPYISDPKSELEGDMNLPPASIGETDLALIKRARRCWDWPDMFPDHLSECIGAQLLMFQHFDSRTVPPPRVEEEL